MGISKQNYLIFCCFDSVSNPGVEFSLTHSLTHSVRCLPKVLSGLLSRARRVLIAELTATKIMAGELESKKRKSRDASGDVDGAAKKKRKRQSKKKAAGVDEEDLDVEFGVNRSFERMDSQLLADYIAQKTARFGTDLSTVELSDLYLSGEKMRGKT